MTALRDARLILNVDELIGAVLDGEVEITSAEDVICGMLRVGRNPAPHLLATLYYKDLIDRWWLPRLVPDAWTGAEFPMIQLERDAWRELWTVCGYTHDERRRARPRKPRRLYRGADHAHRDGWSWTPDPAVAGWFANRFPELRAEQGTPGQVWTALVPPEAMLATILNHRPGEPETVVDTAGLLIEPAEVTACPTSRGSVPRASRRCATRGAS